VQLVSSAALVVVSGMGGITDVFADYAGGVLRTLDLAAQHGVATAMMGQGLGPLRDGPLRRLAAIVLPRVDLIALREARAGAPLLRALGVSPARVVTTGDDAIEVAYRLATPDLGGDLGINLRRSDYAGVDTALVEALAPALARSARRHAAMLVGLPISRVPGEEDAVTIAALRGDPGNPSDREPLALPALLERIRRCRVVVTGSYHAGVFALASGIPVVALARSPYYVDKFDGLADQFGDGCAVVRLDADGVDGRLEAAIEQSWARAGDLRPALLGAAARQIELGHAAYRRLATLVRPGPLAAR
jgi:colanic acid/amylovoran biosynthesis protein